MRRVVVTGLGILTPLGLGVENNWNRIVSGLVGINKIDDFDVSDLPCKIAGQIPRKSDDPEGGLSIDEWIDQTLAAKGYIQAQEHREDFILATGAGATKFNKWMKKAGLVFNKQTGRWTRWEDR